MGDRGVVFLCFRSRVPCFCSPAQRADRDSRAASAPLTCTSLGRADRDSGQPCIRKARVAHSPGSPSLPRQVAELLNPSFTETHTFFMSKARPPPTGPLTSCPLAHSRLGGP